MSAHTSISPPSSSQISSQAARPSEVSKPSFAQPSLMFLHHSHHPLAPLSKLQKSSQSSFESQGAPSMESEDPDSSTYAQTFGSLA